MALHSRILLGMVVGIVAGIAVGPNSPLFVKDRVVLLPGAEVRAAPGGELLGAAIGREAEVIDSRPVGELLWLQIRGAGEGPEAAATGWVAERPEEVRLYSGLGQRLVDWTEWLGRLFLALIKMVVVPLVFLSLLTGIASMGDYRRLGRLGGRTLALFLATTVIALVVGVTLVNLVGPGRLVAEEDRQLLLASYQGEAGGELEEAGRMPSVADRVVALVPENPAKAMADGEMLQIILFATILGIAMTMLPGDRMRPVVELFERLNEAVVQVVQIVMKMAPVGVAALLFKVVGSTSVTMLAALVLYGGVVVVGLVLHFTVTYGLMVHFGARRPWPAFLRALRPVHLLAFSTSSSSATLPVTMECCERQLGLSEQVSRFVPPLGATVNMDGTALYMGVATVFIAQVYGIELGLSGQLSVILLAVLGSVGAAGVPGTAIAVLVMMLTECGIPVEGLALILGLDRLLDMFRTVVNVTGDCVVAAVVDRAERRAR